MAVVTYINFNGNCRDALAFYEGVFHTESPVITTYGSQQSNYPLPEEAKDMVMHTSMNIMGTQVMFSDVFDYEHFITGNNISLTLISDDKKALEDVFHKLSVNGEVKTPLQQTFWSSLYGFVTDQFGVSWQVSHEDVKSPNA